MATEIIVFGIKIASMKRNLNLCETVENTHDLRKKIKDHLTVPDMILKDMYKTRMKMKKLDLQLSLQPRGLLHS